MTTFRTLTSLLHQWKWAAIFRGSDGIKHCAWAERIKIQDCVITIEVLKISRSLADCCVPHMLKHLSRRLIISLGPRLSADSPHPGRQRDVFFWGNKCSLSFCYKQFRVTGIESRGKTQSHNQLMNLHWSRRLDWWSGFGIESELLYHISVESVVCFDLEMSNTLLTERFRVVQFTELN